MKRILFLTDSLSLPQARDGKKIRLEDTYLYRFRAHFNGVFDVISFQKGGGTSADLLSQARYYAACEPDLVVVQVGIVDCAPL